MKNLIIKKKKNFFIIYENSIIFKIENKNLYKFKFISKKINIYILILKLLKQFGLIKF